MRAKPDPTPQAVHKATFCGTIFRIMAQIKTEPKENVAAPKVLKNNQISYKSN